MNCKVNQMNSQHQKIKNGQLVLPGERLGVIEEFIPDAETYVKEGIICSQVFGRVMLNLKDRRISVYPLLRKVIVPKVGSLVLGQVSNVKNENANIRIFKIGNRSLSGFFTGILHISDVQPKYVESMFDVCKPGDIARAKVISDKNRVYHLSIKDKNLGILYAFCSQCGYMLELKRQTMKCPRCGRIEKRKVTLDYGKGIL